MDTIEQEAHGLLVSVLMDEVPMLSHFAAEAIVKVQIDALTHHGLLREDSNV